MTKKQGDMRGTYYDSNGLSYLFDMNDPCEGEEREKLIQKAYHNEFFPLCLDSMFYGNEARFINHSCDPNLNIFNVYIDCLDPDMPRLCLFAKREIKKSVFFSSICSLTPPFTPSPRGPGGSLSPSTTASPPATPTAKTQSKVSALGSDQSK